MQAAMELRELDSREIDAVAGGPIIAAPLAFKIGKAIGYAITAGAAVGGATAAGVALTEASKEASQAMGSGSSN